MHELQPQTEIGKNGSKTKITGLNVDVLFLIFNELDLQSVINMIEANPRFHSLAVAVFRIKYKKHEVILSNTFDPKAFGWNGNILKFKESNKYTSHIPYLRLFDLEMTLKALKYFGAAFKKIEVSSIYNSKEWATINKYGSEWLTHLKHIYSGLLFEKKH